MITFNDCLSLSGLPEDLVDVVSEHEHIPEIVALELADHLLHSLPGEIRLCGFIEEELSRARRHHDDARAGHLEQVLMRLLESHPLSGTTPVPS